MSAGKSQPTGSQNPDAAGEKSVPRPKLGRRGRREIGRALEAMYEGVVKQGIPAPILELIDGLDARVGSSPDASAP
jgi:hypothetical protein